MTKADVITELEIRRNTIAQRIANRKEFWGTRYYKVFTTRAEHDAFDLELYDSAIDLITGDSK